MNSSGISHTSRGRVVAFLTAALLIAIGTSGACARDDGFQCDDEGARDLSSAERMELERMVAPLRRPLGGTLTWLAPGPRIAWNAPVGTSTELQMKLLAASKPWGSRRDLVPACPHAMVDLSMVLTTTDGMLAERLDGVALLHHDGRRTLQLNMGSREPGAGALRLDPGDHVAYWLFEFEVPFSGNATMRAFLRTHDGAPPTIDLASWTGRPNQTVR